MNVKELREALAAYPDDMEVHSLLLFEPKKKKHKRMCIMDRSKVCNLCHECDIDPDVWYNNFSR